jgi:hypothetical protein
MKVRRGIAIAACAAAFGLSGCGETCPTETPQVQDVADCTAQANTTVTYPVRLCPTCNQTGASCDVDLSAAASQGIIHLDPVVEACNSANTCPPGCDVQPFSCTFTAPSQPGTYEVLVFDPGRNGTISGTLEIVPSGALSCSGI